MALLHPAALRRGRVVLSLAVVASAACRSGGAPPPRTVPGPPSEFSKSYVGQLRILRFIGDKRSVSLNRKEVGQASGPCDIAVQIRVAALENGTARFALDPIGYPSVAGRKRGARCDTIPGQNSLTILGFATDEPFEQTAADVDKILQTPEGYLAAHGVVFDRPAGADDKVAADPRVSGETEERYLARAVTAWQQRLLWVDAFYRDPAHKVRYEGEIEFVAVVGSDGRIHQPRLLTPLGQHDERVLGVLSLWRYEPARRGEQAVAARIVERTAFRIF